MLQIRCARRKLSNAPKLSARTRKSKGASSSPSWMTLQSPLIRCTTESDCLALTDWDRPGWTTTRWPWVNPLGSAPNTEGMTLATEKISANNENTVQEVAKLLRRPVDMNNTCTRCECIVYIHFRCICAEFLGLTLLDPLTVNRLDNNYVHWIIYPWKHSSSYKQENLSLLVPLLTCRVCFVINSSVGSYRYMFRNP